MKTALTHSPRRQSFTETWTRPTRCACANSLHTSCSSIDWRAGKCGLQLFILFDRLKRLACTHLSSGPLDDISLSKRSIHPSLCMYGHECATKPINRVLTKHSTRHSLRNHDRQAIATLRKAASIFDSVSQRRHDLYYPPAII